MEKQQGQDQLYTLAKVSKLTNTPKPFIKKYISPAHIEPDIKPLKLTYFYTLIEVKNFIESKNGQTHLDAYNTSRRIYKTTTYENCYVAWFEWYGRKPNEFYFKRETYGATVSVKNKTATITLESGKSFTKRIYTKGFHFEPGINQPAIMNEAFDFESYDPAEQ